MDPTTAIGSVLAAFGLAGAAGFNAWLPLFVSALLARLDVVEMAAPFDELSTTTGLVVLGGLLVLDFVGDKVPAIDHALHTAGSVIAPISGAVLFAGEAGTEADVPVVVSVLAGGALAELVHLARAAVRAASSATTAGLGNPVLSLAEDGSSAALTVVAFAAPVIGFVLLLGLLATAVVLWRAYRRRASSAGAQARP